MIFVDSVIEGPARTFGGKSRPAIGVVGRGALSCRELGKKVKRRSRELLASTDRYMT